MKFTIWFVPATLYFLLVHGLHLSRDAVLERRAKIGKARPRPGSPGRNSPARPSQSVNPVDDTFNRMRNHIFLGETRNSKSGRHLLSSFCAANRGEKGECNDESKICKFSRKTVWDDRPGGYTRADVETMCKAAIKLNLPGRSTASFFVQTRLGRPICVTHLVAKSQNSCFPQGVNFRKDVANSGGSFKIGDHCPPNGTGDDVDKANRKRTVDCKDV
ncbi:unnamed protein product [Cyclocybe aegerita]|uniref:Uncharacterized protein n=1 Tax=Cyclocybe aegerita TaxID=1973307 RepID=A0A8S0VZ22_CYCAE|nr:unnamed protein product [Cyclocybe aegerita]